MTPPTPAPAVAKYPLCDMLVNTLAIKIGWGKAPLPVEPEVPELETEMVYYCHRNSKDKLRKDV